MSDDPELKSNKSLIRPIRIMDLNEKAKKVKAEGIKPGDEDWSFTDYEIEQISSFIIAQNKKIVKTWQQAAENATEAMRQFGEAIKAIGEDPEFQRVMRELVKHDHPQMSYGYKVKDEEE